MIHEELVDAVCKLSLPELLRDNLNQASDVILLNLYNQNSGLSREIISKKFRLIKIILNFDKNLNTFDLWVKSEDELVGLYYEVLNLTSEDKKEFNSNPMLSIVQYRFYKGYNSEDIFEKMYKEIEKKEILQNKLAKKNLNNNDIVDIKGDIFTCKNKILLLKVRLYDIKQEILGNVTNQELIDELASLEKELQFWEQQLKSDLESYAEEINSSNKSAREQDIRDDERNINNIQARIAEINQQIFSSSTGGRR